MKRTRSYRGKLVKFPITHHATQSNASLFFPFRKKKDAGRATLSASKLRWQGRIASHDSNENELQSHHKQTGPPTKKKTILIVVSSDQLCKSCNEPVAMHMDRLTSRTHSFCCLPFWTVLALLWFLVMPSPGTAVDLWLTQGITVTLAYTVYFRVLTNSQVCVCNWKHTPTHTASSCNVCLFLVRLPFEVLYKYIRFES